MDNKAVQVDSVGKKYYIGETVSSDRTLATAFVDGLTAPFRRARDIVRGNKTGAAELKKEFWALRDISFEVNHGEIVGIIGGNGAGKSTLLKLLSRITNPTEGRIVTLGRVASLLEVGTGFHQELTGRENVFLNGAILGMSGREISKKFDEIVDFAEVEKFIDTPVKHYSSGMVVRLGFAVAAHLEPEILVIDEVLAVGDTAFQKKCLAKIEGVSRSGRTILFVSHSMTSISRLCPRTLFLENGRLMFDGQTHEAVKKYLKWESGQSIYRTWENELNQPGSDVVKLRSVKVHTPDDSNDKEFFDIHKPITVTIEYDVMENGHKLTPNFHFYNQEGICVFVSLDNDPEWYAQHREMGRYRSCVVIPGNFLAEGIMYVSVAITTLSSMFVHFFEREVVSFQVVDQSDGESVRGNYAGNLPGIVRPMLEWQSTFTSSEKSIIDPT